MPGCSTVYSSKLVNMAVYTNLKHTLTLHDHNLSILLMYVLSC